LVVLLPDGSANRQPLRCATLTLRHEAKKAFATLLVKSQRFSQSLEDRSGLFGIVPIMVQLSEQRPLPCEVNHAPGDVPLNLCEILPQDVLIHGANDPMSGEPRRAQEAGPHRFSASRQSRGCSRCLSTVDFMVR
jgi:hypothetical protein